MLLLSFVEGIQLNGIYKTTSICS